MGYILKEEGNLREFDYSLDFSSIDFRKNPELYRIGRGEQGVLLVEPYKSEILPFWRFRTPAIARTSAARIYQLFKKYQKRRDFVGMDMARKFLQMGYTRSRRYANHEGGRKYSNGQVLPRTINQTKARSAAIFKQKWDLVRKDPVYLSMKTEHRLKVET